MYLAKSRDQLVYQLIDAIRLLSKPSFLMDQASFNLEDFVILDFLVEQQTCTMKDIVTTFSLAPSTATGIVDRLVAKNYVVRSHSEVDRRRVTLQLTSEGREAIQTQWSHIMTATNASLQSLSEEEITTLVQLIQKISLGE